MHEDAKRFVATCPECQRSGNISQRNAMPLNYNLQIDLFDVWGIDFMGPFVNSNGYEHILVVVDYVSKWVEAIPCRKASTKEAIQMIKTVIFPRYGVPRILISDGGSHFIGKDFKDVWQSWELSIGCLRPIIHKQMAKRHRTSKSKESS
jgi:hypothetical protein